MIDFETVLFIGVLKTLAEKTKNPFVAFSNIHYDDYEGAYVYEMMILITIIALFMMIKKDDLPIAVITVRHTL